MPNQKDLQNRSTVSDVVSRAPSREEANLNGLASSQRSFSVISWTPKVGVYKETTYYEISAYVSEASCTCFSRSEEHGKETLAWRF